METSQTAATRVPEGARRPEVLLAGDHAAVTLKGFLVTALNQAGFAVVDLGASGESSVDYPDYGRALAEALSAGQGERGILICGTGMGIAMAANRYSHVRAAVCHDVTTARLGRRHNDANVLALGARVTGEEVAKEAAEAFLTTAFEGGRHQRRIDKLSEGGSTAVAS